MSSILRRAPSRTIKAIRQIIISHIEKMRDELFADHKKDIGNAHDEIEAAKINAIFHEKLAFLYRQLAEELGFFNAALQTAKELDEKEWIDFLRRYFAARRRMIAANIEIPESEGNGTDKLLETILKVFIVGFWIGYISQIKRHEHIYSLSIRDDIDELEQFLSKKERILFSQVAHTKKNLLRSEKGD